jgi:hypothetical protein
MKSSVLLCATSTLALAAAPAHAGGYLSLGVGTTPELDAGSRSLEAASRSGRLELGQRVAWFAVEGAVGGFQLGDTRAMTYDVVAASAGAKIFVNLQGPLDAFVRGGGERTWLIPDGDALETYRGDGGYAGVGVELRLALPLGSTALWMDYTVHRAALRNSDGEIDGDHGRWTLGVSIGL